MKMLCRPDYIPGGSDPRRFRLERDTDGFLIGLISAIEGGPRYRVEMLMRIDANCDSLAEAKAFALGVFVGLDTFRVLPGVPKPHNESSQAAQPLLHRGQR